MFISLSLRRRGWRRYLRKALGVGVPEVGVKAPAAESGGIAAGDFELFEEFLALDGICTEGEKVIGGQLAVDHQEFPSFCLFTEGKKGSLRRVAFGVKHRFTEECASKRYAVESPYELSIVPSFNGVSKPQMVELGVCCLNFWRDPRGVACIGTEVDDFFECGICAHFEVIFSAHEFTHAARDIRFGWFQEHAWVGRVPGQR